MTDAPAVPSDPRLVATLKRCSAGAGLLAVLVGCTVLAGWIFDIEPLRRPIPVLVEMNQLAAFDFILFGLTLAFLLKEDAGRPPRFLARAAALFVGLTSLLKVSGVIFGVDIPIDHLLFQDILARSTNPNRMAPTTGFNLFLLAVAFLAVDVETRKGHRPSQTLSLLVVAISALAMVGYLYGVTVLTGIARYTPMALHTAFAFLLVAGGILCRDPDRGWMGRTTSPGAGGQMIRSILIVIIGAPILLGYFILAGQRAGRYDAPFAFSLLVFSVIIFFSGLIWMNAISLDRKDAERARADADLRNAHEELEERVGERTVDLSHAVSEIAAGVEVLSSSAKEILDSTVQLAAAGVRTTTALAQTTTTVEEIRQTSQVSSDKAMQVAAQARTAAEISQEGRGATDAVRAGMRRIDEQMRAIAGHMTRLSEQSRAIGEIIAAVEDFSRQSNMIAVNAAIEAASAGEHGKGFAVVAREVKRLADQSKEATKRVGAILNDVQKATHTAALSTEQGSLAVLAGVEESARASKAIVSLAESVTSAAAAAAQIAAASRQQLVGMDQVAMAMGSIQEASAQNVDSARQIEAAASGLSSLGGKLREFARQIGK